MVNMSKNLLIVESPTKARTIGKYLGNDFEVIATVGHLRDLPGNKMAVDMKNDFEVEYVVDPKKKKVVDEIIRSARTAKKIFLATDPDREGEAISWHVKWLMENSVYKKSDKNKIDSSLISRVTFHEITKDAIEEAIKNSRDIDMDMVNAQQGRRVLDRVVGYSLSPVLWRKVRRGLSAGRVQSVAVRLICEREKEIQAFKKEKYFKVLAKLNKSGNNFEADLIAVDKKKFFQTQKIKLFDGDYTFSKSIFGKEDEVSQFISNLDKEFTVDKVIGRETHRSPLPAFMTSKLQQAAARKFGWSGKQTMSVAQKLYENGLITYHRTDSVYLSDKAIGEFRKFIGNHYGNEYVSAKVRLYKNTAKNAQEAHEAIRPSKVEITHIEGDLRENKLYEMIWKRAVATQAAGARMEKTVIKLSNRNGDFETNGVRMLFDGFLKITEEKHEDQILPILKEGEKILQSRIDKEEVETNPPPRYSDASLVASLEKQGIGRPSTYAPIISTIQARQYVEKEEGRFLPTALGVATNEFLVKNFPDVLSLPFTAGMEENLDKISLGKMKWKVMMKNFWNKFEKDVKLAENDSERVRVETEKLNEKCPECKEGELVIRVGRFGKFVSCGRFPECKYTAPFKELAGFNCPECGAEGVVKRTKTGRKFFGCFRYPDCKWAGWKKP
ncbi:MAG: type I DNA topoisomerase [Candidatus Shapirobacteria bacterium]|nr:type I DNA topoisomerase [Candidatus Shapirobacteria bacterium]